MVQSGFTCFFMTPSTGHERGRMSTRTSGKRSQERIHGVNQILPGRFHGLLKLCQLGVIGILEVRDAALKLCKARAYVFEFPVMLELDANLLLGESALKLRHAGRQILDFPDNLVQIHFFSNMTASQRQRE